MKCISIALFLMFVVTTYHYQEDDHPYRTEQLQYMAADDRDFNINVQNLLIDQSPLFTLENAAPGDSQTKYIKVQNSNCFDMEYVIFFQLKETSQIEEVIYIKIEKLNEEIVYIPGYQIEDLILTNKKLIHDEEDIYKITVGIDENAGNEYNQSTPLKFSFDILFTSSKSKHVNQQELLDQDYLVPIQHQDHITIQDGTITLEFPKIKVHNGWSLKKGKLYFDQQVMHDDPLITTLIGIKLDSLLASNQGYTLTSINLNDVDLMNDASNQWKETNHEDYSHLLYIKIGDSVGNQTNLNQYKLEPNTHHLKITITNNDGHSIIFNLEIKVIQTTNHVHDKQTK